MKNLLFLFFMLTLLVACQKDQSYEDKSNETTVRVNSNCGNQDMAPSTVGLYHTKMTEIAVSFLEDAKRSNLSAEEVRSKYYNAILVDSLSSISGISKSCIKQAYSDIELDHSSIEEWSSAQIVRSEAHQELIDALMYIVRENYSVNVFKEKVYELVNTYDNPEIDPLLIAYASEVAISSYEYWYNNLDRLVLLNPVSLLRKDNNPHLDNIVEADIEGAVGGFLVGLVTGPGLIVTTLGGAVGGTLVKAARAVWWKIWN